MIELNKQNPESELKNQMRQMYSGEDQAALVDVCNLWISAIKSDAHIDYLTELLNKKYGNMITRISHCHNQFAALPLLLVNCLLTDIEIDSTNDVNMNLLMKKVGGLYYYTIEFKKQSSNDNVRLRRRDAFINNDMQATHPIFSKGITVEQSGRNDKNVLRLSVKDAEYYSFYFYQAFRNCLPDDQDSLLYNADSVQMRCKRLELISEKIDDNQNFLNELKKKNKNSKKQPYDNKFSIETNQVLFKIGQIQFLKKIDNDFLDSKSIRSLQILPELFVLHSPSSGCNFYKNDPDFIYLRNVNILFNTQFPEFYLAKHMFFSMMYMWDISNNPRECITPKLLCDSQISKLLECAKRIYLEEYSVLECSASQSDKDIVDDYITGDLLNSFSGDMLDYIENWIIEPIHFMSDNYRAAKCDRDKSSAKKIENRYNKSIERLKKYTSYYNPVTRLVSFKSLLTEMKKTQ